MSTLSTQVPPRGTQILEYSMQYCLKYLYSNSKGPGSPKFPCMSHRQNKARHKAVNAMDNNNANIQHNKLMQLENSMLMYGVYNVET